MGAVKFDKNKMNKLFKAENDYILDVLTNFNVPDSNEHEDDENFLLDTKKKNAKTQVNPPTSVMDLEDRLKSIKNKLTKKKKVNASEKKLKKQHRKLNKNKEFKKVLQTAGTTIKKEQSAINHEYGASHIKKMAKPIFNAEGKIVFSKFDFAGSKGKKRTGSEKVVKNPELALGSMIEMNKQLKKMEVDGDQDKAEKLKTDIAWKKAFDKIDGKKVKDDPRLLQKTIKRRQDEKKKSKKQWMERTAKVEQKKENKQKKRTENINKRQKDRRHMKLKKMSKKGRVIPGF